MSAVLGCFWIFYSLESFSKSDQLICNLSRVSHEVQYGFNDKEANIKFPGLEGVVYFLEKFTDEISTFDAEKELNQINSHQLNKKSDDLIAALKSFTETYKVKNLQNPSQEGQPPSIKPASVMFKNYFINPLIEQELSAYL